MAEVVGSGAEAFEELGLETPGRGTFELRHGFDLLLRPSRFIFADAARDHEVVVTHGSGPQVGALAARAPLSAVLLWAEDLARRIDEGIARIVPLAGKDQNLGFTSSMGKALQHDVRGSAPGVLHQEHGIDAVFLFRDAIELPHFGSRGDA